MCGSHVARHVVLRTVRAMRTHEEIVQRHLVAALEANGPRIAESIQKTPPVIGPDGNVDVNIDLGMVVDLATRSAVEQFAPLVAAAVAVTRAGTDRRGGATEDLVAMVRQLEGPLAALGVTV